MLYKTACNYTEVQRAASSYNKSENLPETLPLKCPFFDSIVTPVREDHTANELVQKITSHTWWYFNPSPTLYKSYTSIVGPLKVEYTSPWLYSGIRFFNGRENDTQGLIEVCYQGDWRSVCDDYWTDHDAKVACEQLGFSKSNFSECRKLLINTRCIFNHLTRWQSN